MDASAPLLPLKKNEKRSQGKHVGGVFVLRQTLLVRFCAGRLLSGKPMLWICLLEKHVWMMHIGGKHVICVFVHVLDVLFKGNPVVDLHCCFRVRNGCYALVCARFSGKHCLSVLVCPSGNACCWCPCSKRTPLSVDGFHGRPFPMCFGKKETKTKSKTELDGVRKTRMERLPLLRRLKVGPGIKRRKEAVQDSTRT